ncbi:MAG: ABC transporter permease [Betaproteobacteria bacterium]|jgi:NitT/TauT family transport system permease protein
MSPPIVQAQSIDNSSSGAKKKGVLLTLVLSSSTVILPLLLALAVLLMWEYGVQLAGIPEVILPAPSSIFKVMISKNEILLRHSAPTILESAGGFALASILGISLAILLSYSRFASEALYPNLVFFQLIPKIALAPLFIIWFGIGSESRLAFAVFISFFPIVISTIAGFASVDTNMVRLCRSLTATEWQIFTSVKFPAALPYIFSGMKVAMTMAIIGVIIGEFITAQQGLGYLIVFATARADTVVGMAAITTLCAGGLLLYGLVAAAEAIANRYYGVPRG